VVVVVAVVLGLATPESILFEKNWGERARRIEAFAEESILFLRNRTISTLRKRDFFKENDIKR
jgi:hypothetical protein